MAKYLYSALILLALAIGFFLLPETVRYTLDLRGEILPVKEWMLVRDVDGTLNGSILDHRQGATESYSVKRFERGDNMQFQLHPIAQAATTIAAGDTIGQLYSNDAMRQIAELTGDLESRLAALRFAQSGDKPALVESARQELERAQARLEGHRNIMTRTEELYAQQLVSAQEVEDARSQHLVFEADVAIARALLDARQTGESEERVAVSEAKVRELQGQLDVLQTRVDQFTITAPFAGEVARYPYSDTLFVLRDPTAFVVIMPVKSADHQLVQPDQDVHFYVPGIEDAVLGTVYRSGNTVHQLNNEQVLVVTAVIPEPAAGLHPGMMVDAAIDVGHLGLMDYIKRMLN